MNLSEMIGITSEQTLRIAAGALAIVLLIGFRFWWRNRTEQRVRLDLSDRG